MRVFFVFILFLSAANCAKILAFFYVPSISHQHVFRAITKELSLRGHEVTYATTDPENDQRYTNLTEIDISVAYEAVRRVNANLINRYSSSLIKIMMLRKSALEEVASSVLKSRGVQELLRRPEGSFDLILTEIHTSAFFGLQHLFKAPLIAVSSENTYSYFHDAFGNPTHPVLYPHITTENCGPIKNMWDKLDSIYTSIVWYFMSEYYLNPRDDEIVRPYFGTDMPYIGDMVKKASLMLLNVSPIFSERRPVAPNVIEFFNVHITHSGNPLPKVNTEIQATCMNRYHHLHGHFMDTGTQYVDAVYIHAAIYCIHEDDENFWDKL